MFDSTKIPPIFGTGHWKTDVAYYYKKKLLFTTVFYWKKVSTAFGLEY